MPRKAKGQRTDLNRPTQAIKVAPSQQYGQGAQQIAAQKAIPLPSSGPVGGRSLAPTGPAASPNGPGVPPAMLGDLGPLDRPTDRPNEPLTTGVSTGAGAGPEVLTDPDEAVGQTLRALYTKFPNKDLLDLIEAFDDNQQFPVQPPEPIQPPRSVQSLMPPSAPSPQSLPPGPPPGELPPIPGMPSPGMPPPGMPSQEVPPEVP